MHDTTAITTPQARPVVAYRRDQRYAQFHRHYPTTDYLRRRARRHIPHFAFEYADGGSGKGDAGIRRNWAALDAIEMVPRYGVMPSLPACDVELFGRRYNAPVGVAPMGGPSIIWPGGDLHLARAAQRAGLPYALSTAGGATIEEAEPVAPEGPGAPAILKPGTPRFASLRSYVGPDPSLNEVIAFARREIQGAFTWDEVRMYRDRWKGTLIVKGVLHPQDAETAVALGVDGIIVSNHGGRQVEALPA